MWCSACSRALGVIGALTLIPYVSVVGLPLAWGLLVISLLRLLPDETSWYLLEQVR